MNITLGFLNYNSVDYIKQQIDRDYISMSEGIINEVIIQDDCYEGDFEKLQELKYPNLKIFKNEKNLKPLLSRQALAKNGTNDWIWMMDSDNFLDKKSFEFLIKNKDKLRKDTIYCPSFARPKFDYKILSNFSMDFNFVRDELFNPLHNTLLCFLNTGNYLVGRKNYIRVGEKIDNYFAPFTMEVFYFNYLWLKYGGYIECVENFEYDHTIRTDCFSNSMNSKDILLKIINLYCPPYSI